MCGLPKAITRLNSNSNLGANDDINSSRLAFPSLRQKRFLSQGDVARNEFFGYLKDELEKAGRGNEYSTIKKWCAAEVDNGIRFFKLATFIILAVLVAKPLAWLFSATKDGGFYYWVQYPAKPEYLTYLAAKSVPFKDNIEQLLESGSVEKFVLFAERQKAVAVFSPKAVTDGFPLRLIDKVVYFSLAEKLGVQDTVPVEDGRMGTPFYSIPLFLFSFAFLISMPFVAAKRIGTKLASVSMKMKVRRALRAGKNMSLFVVSILLLFAVGKCTFPKGDYEALVGDTHEHHIEKDDDGSENWYLWYYMKMNGDFDIVGYLQHENLDNRALENQITVNRIKANTEDLEKALIVRFLRDFVPEGVTRIVLETVERNSEFYGLLGFKWKIENATSRKVANDHEMIKDAAGVYGDIVPRGMPEIITQAMALEWQKVNGQYTKELIAELAQTFGGVLLRHGFNKGMDTGKMDHEHKEKIRKKFFKWKEKGFPEEILPGIPKWLEEGLPGWIGNPLPKEIEDRVCSGVTGIVGNPVVVQTKTKKRKHEGESGVVKNPAARPNPAERTKTKRKYDGMPEIITQAMALEWQKVNGQYTKELVAALARTFGGVLTRHGFTAKEGQALEFAHKEKIRKKFYKWKEIGFPEQILEGIPKWLEEGLPGWIGKPLPKDIEDSLC
ncbi:hypothetical protein Ddc_10578 [Ditylenchus destructor]|nr:hypothetical protein Ddc_10578 [Ditylenchus destructor]